MIKNTVIIASLLCFLLALPLLTAYSSADAVEAPPVAQELVREGDFALKLAETLKLGNPAGEAEAISALAAAGIAPRNGWIADYPVTPDVLVELEVAVGDAADAGRLTAARDESLHAFKVLASGFGLAVAAAPQTGYVQNEPPQNYPQYSDPAVVHHHYYHAGPPVVTYYPPPPDYYYLYSWVPYSFYWHSFLFPGFFILHDFNRVVFVQHRVVKVVSNHVFVPRFRKVVIVDHRSRIRGTVFEDGREVRGRSRLDSPEARRGASSIMERSRSRSGSGFSDSSRALEDRRTSGSRSGTITPESRRDERTFTNRGSGSGTSGSGGRSGSFSRPDTGRRPEGSRPEVLPDNRGQRSFNRPDASGSRSGRSFERPSTSGSGRPSFSSPSIRSGSGSGGGGRPEMRGGSDRSDGSRPEIRGGSGSRGGGSSGRGGSARSGSSGGGCRGRC